MSRVHSSNNFDAVRLLAAGMVLCSHQFALTARSQTFMFGRMTLGTVGVLVFFSVSGYLVALSWDRDPHVLRFAAKRLLRIWPGLAVVTLVAACLLGPLVTTWNLADYVRSPLTRDYFSQLYFSIQQYLPGVFEHSPFPIVNGSLWTIPIEVRWYGVLLLVGACGLLRHSLRGALLGLVCAYAVYIYLVYDVQHNPDAGLFHPGFGCEYGSFFCYGAALFRFRETWQRHPWRLLAALVVLGTILAACGYGYAALYVLLPFVVIRVGTWSTPVLRRCGRFGDFSYGIYIYAFMVQKTLVQWLGTHQPYAVGLFLTVVFTLPFAVLSWYLVERPALGLKRHLPGTGASATNVSSPSAAGAALVNAAPATHAGGVAVMSTEPDA